ncbi:MAG TPA: hypothetical protein VLK85_05045 [Ramlibacter sp.]|nr:hypothetical protein [Ramlibacter sp.]
MRSALMFLAALLAAACALAQAPAGAPAPAPSTTPARPAALEREPLEGRTNQRVERIRHEDAGARIDELRVGGVTQSVTVQPSANVPPYEVLPSSAARARPAGPRDELGNTAGQPAWNLRRF